MAFWRKEDKKKDAEDPQAFVARREYDKAIKAYRGLLTSEPGNYVYHHKVAEVYCLAGKQSDSIDDYSKAADGYARDGFLIKAVAILKKMQKIAPDNPSITKKLEELSESGSSASSRIGKSDTAGGTLGRGAEISLDMEELDDVQSIPLAGEGDPGEEGESADGEPQAPPRGEIPMEMEEPSAAKVFETPLFSELKRDELHEVMTRLRHHSFPAGTTLVKEGEPGDSLFVMCEGKVRVSTSGPKGKPVQLAELSEGDFFGEVSLLTGKPRTATIVSLVDTEVLELTRSDLEELEGRHPRVRQVIKDFYERRVASTVEAMIQAVRPPKKRS